MSLICWDCENSASYMRKHCRPEMLEPFRCASGHWWHYQETLPCKGSFLVYYVRQGTEKTVFFYINSARILNAQETQDHRHGV